MLILRWFYKQVPLVVPNLFKRPRRQSTQQSSEIMQQLYISMTFAAIYWMVVAKSSNGNATFAESHSPQQHFKNVENNKNQYFQGNT